MHIRCQKVWTYGRYPLHSYTLAWDTQELMCLRRNIYKECVIVCVVRFWCVYFWDLISLDIVYVFPSIPIRIESWCNKNKWGTNNKNLPSFLSLQGSCRFLSVFRGHWRHETEFMDDKSIIIRPLYIFAAREQKSLKQWHITPPGVPIPYFSILP